MIIHTVLVVDDDLTVCQIVDRMLSDEHYKVRTSQSVADALGAIERSPFDVDVMDYRLPGGSGLNVADRIRSKSSVAPIILISGYDPSAVALRAEKPQIADFLGKPFSREIICRAVKKAWLARRPPLNPKPNKSSASPQFSTEAGLQPAAAVFGQGSI